MPNAGDRVLAAGVVSQVSAVKIADETVNNSSAFQDDDVLTCDFQINTRYKVIAVLIYNSNSTADFKFRFSETSAGGVSGYFDASAIPLGGSASTDVYGNVGTTFTAEGTGDRTIVVVGRLDVGANAGRLYIQWAQNTTNLSNTIVKAGSYLHLQAL